MPDMSTPIGPYRGIPVGRGGFATVYRVDGPLALKWADRDADVEILASLFHEFDVGSELIHPQIPRTLEIGSSEGRPFIVSQFIDGPPLAETIPHARQEDFVDVLSRLGRVLWFLHRRGWVHGDLKPDNIRWGRTAGSADGMELYLLDFGLARRVGDEGRPRGAGTIGYCAPEFLECCSADGRADWYAVGAILYEWVYGQRPFAAAEPAVEIAGHCETPPDLSRTPVRPAPSWAPEVIERLLSKNADARAADEWSLLAWLAEYVPALEPSHLINCDRDWYRRSEDRRVIASEREFVASLVPPATEQPVDWVVDARGEIVERYLTLTVAVMVREGYAVANAPPADMKRDDGARSRLRGESVTVPPAHLTIEWIGARLPTSAGAAEIPPPQTRTVSILPWNGPRVTSYLAGLTGDEEFATFWSPHVLRQTGGIPSAVSALIGELMQEDHLRVSDGRWQIDETALTGWSEGETARPLFAAATGELDEAETRVCEWLALGRSFGSRRLLRALCTDDCDDCDAVIDRLVHRGVIVVDPATDLDTRLRLDGHDGTLRGSMPVARRRCDARRLAELLSAEVLTPEWRHAAVTAACCADAHRWDHAAEFAVRAASLELARDNRDEAERLVARAEDAAARITDAAARTGRQGRACLVLGDLRKATGQIEEALRAYREVLRLGRRVGDRHLLADALKKLGDLYRITRRFDKGVRALRIARRLWEELGDRAQVSRTLNNLGNMYWVAADRERARDHWEAALVIQRTMGLDESAATTLSNLGALHLVAYEYALAERSFRDALAIHERLDIPVEKAGALNNLGAVAFMQGRIDEAEAFFSRAAEFNRDAGAESEEVFNRRNLLEVALERGDLRTVVATGEDVKAAADALGDVATAVEVGALLAEAFLRAGDFRRAENHLQNVRETCARIRNDDLDVELALVSVSFNLRLVEYDEATEALDRVGASGSAVNRHLNLDATILRMRLAVIQGDTSQVERLWADGSAEAAAIGAPHKKALLAFARLPEDPTDGFDETARCDVEQFLKMSGSPHWEGAFLLWSARLAVVRQEWEAAEHCIEMALARLKRDGNWETLWRALAVRGQIAHARADYEPALRAFDEAGRILQAIGRTIESSEQRQRYVQHPLACRMVELRTRITELVG
ncbi:MAG TPA: tetratricopeptide repeat protein [Acidobacteriota bacterium]|nr:tetratricopeptide repeat protein [Acidobacteriota bacterium]